MYLQDLHSELSAFLESVGMPTKVYMMDGIISLVTTSLDPYKKHIVNDVIGIVQKGDDNFRWTILIPELSDDPIELPLKSVATIIRRAWMYERVTKSEKSDYGITLEISSSGIVKIVNNFEGRLNIAYRASGITTVKKNPFLYHWKYILMTLAKNNVIRSRYFTCTQGTNQGVKQDLRGYICGSKWAYANNRFHIVMYDDICPDGVLDPKYHAMVGMYVNAEEYVFKSTKGVTSIKLRLGETYSFNTNPTTLEYSYKVCKRQDSEGQFLYVQRLYRDVVLEEFPLIDESAGYLALLLSPMEYKTEIGIFVPIFEV